MTRGGSVTFVLIAVLQLTGPPGALSAPDIDPDLDQAKALYQEDKYPQKAPKKAKSKTWPIWVGLGSAAAIGAGVAALTGGNSSATPPAVPATTVRISVSPDGTAIPSVTELTFAAATTSLTSPTYAWDFGDGSAGSGQTTVHTYQTEGTFDVRLTATGSPGSATALVNVKVRSVTGLWEPTDMATTRHPQTLDLSQSGATVTGRWRTYDYSVVIEDEPLSGALANPKSINISEHGGCQSQLIGTFNLDLTQLTGTQTRLPMCGVPVQITWVRR